MLINLALLTLSWRLQTLRYLLIHFWERKTSRKGKTDMLSSYVGRHVDRTGVHMLRYPRCVHQLTRCLRSGAGLVELCGCIMDSLGNMCMESGWMGLRRQKKWRRKKTDRWQICMLLGKRGAVLLPMGLPLLYWIWSYQHDADRHELASIWRWCILGKKLAMVELSWWWKCKLAHHGWPRKSIAYLEEQYCSISILG